MPSAASQNSAVVHSLFAADPEYHEILELFNDALPVRRQCLCDAFKAGNFSELQTLAHQLKGAGGGFGFPGLSEHAARLESACKRLEPDLIAAALDETLTYLGRIAVGTQPAC
jgi:histidine phosphotransfer protein HptB